MMSAMTYRKVTLATIGSPTPSHSHSRVNFSIPTQTRCDSGTVVSTKSTVVVPKRVVRVPRTVGAHQNHNFGSCKTHVLWFCDEIHSLWSYLKSTNCGPRRMPKIHELWSSADALITTVITIHTTQQNTTTQNPLWGPVRMNKLPPSAVHCPRRAPVRVRCVVSVVQWS